MAVKPINELTQEAIASSSFCNWGCKDIVAIAISIAGIAISIFSQSILGVIGFVLCGILYLVKKYEHTISLSELENQIKNTLEMEAEMLTHTEDQMEKQVHQIEVDRDAFEQRVHELEMDNDKLLGIQKGLKEEEKKLEGVNATLAQEKEGLTHVLEEEKANASQIRTDVQAIISENLRFGTTTGLFGQGIQELQGTKQQLEEQLAAFDKEFDGDLKTLAEQIQIAKDTSKLLADSAMKRTELLETTLKTLQANVDQRKGVEEQIRQDTEQLRETARQLDEMVRLKGELIRGYDEQILAKQREYQALKMLIPNR